MIGYARHYIQRDRGKSCLRHKANKQVTGATYTLHKKITEIVFTVIQWMPSKKILVPTHGLLKISNRYTRSPPILYILCDTRASRCAYWLWHLGTSLALLQTSRKTRPHRRDKIPWPRATDKHSQPDCSDTPETTDTDGITVRLHIQSCCTWNSAAAGFFIDTTQILR